IVASPSPPRPLFSPVNARVSSAVVTIPTLSVSAVILELLVTPGPSTFERVMLRTFLTVVEATAPPVNIVLPIFEPVPSVDVTTESLGSSASSSVVVALASITGNVSSAGSGGSPLIMFSKSVLSVLDWSGGTSAELADAVETVDGSSGGGVGSGVLVAGSGGLVATSGVLVAVSGVLVATSGVLVAVSGGGSATTFT